MTNAQTRVSARKTVNSFEYLREWCELRDVEPTLTSLEKFQEHDSGWTLSRILNLTINVNKYNPLHAGCYIELPWEMNYDEESDNQRAVYGQCVFRVVSSSYSAFG